MPEQFTQTDNYGRIDIITGCMFSGKSTELIKIINKYKILNKEIIAINHSKDDRYGKNSIITHNKLKVECISIDSLMKIKTNKEYGYDRCDVIVIEEAQFFEDLYNFVIDAADKDHKIVIVAGLDGDSNREIFGDILRLIPLCDTITKLSALCVVCQDGTPANFSKRIVDIKGQELIGSNKEYIPVCRKHYLE